MFVRAARRINANHPIYPLSSQSRSQTFCQRDCQNIPPTFYVYLGSSENITKFFFVDMHAVRLASPLENSASKRLGVKMAGHTFCFSPCLPSPCKRPYHGPRLTRKTNAGNACSKYGAKPPTQAVLGRFHLKCFVADPSSCETIKCRKCMSQVLRNSYLANS